MKNNLAFRAYYKRRLPHIQIPGATYFVTFRLKNSLPIESLEKHAEESRQLKSFLEKEKTFGLYNWLERYDSFLDRAMHSECHLKNAVIADMVMEAIHYRDKKEFDLIAFCIMPNHVHLVLTPLIKTGDIYYSLSEILQSLKRFTAREANKILRRKGSFWQDESYDHFIRTNAEMERIVNYILENPVRAGLTDDSMLWKWSYFKN